MVIAEGSWVSRARGKNYNYGLQGHVAEYVRVLLRPSGPPAVSARGGLELSRFGMVKATPGELNLAREMN